MPLTSTFLKTSRSQSSLSQSLCSGATTRFLQTQYSYDFEKYYPPYLYNDLTHDQNLRKPVTREEGIAIVISTFDIVTESDNRSFRCKSADQLYDLQCISNHTSTPSIRIFGIGGHGKEEVGDVAKIASRREIANGAWGCSCFSAVKISRVYRTNLYHKRN